MLSLMVFVLLYGVVAGAFGWFPRGFVLRAVEQGANLGISPSQSNVQPNLRDREGVHVEKPEKVQPGMTLITSLWDWDDSGDLEIGAKLIDMERQTIHSWRLNRGDLFPGTIQLKGPDVGRADIQGTYLFPNGDLLLNVVYVGAVRVDACGQVVWRLPEFTHHSISRAEDGTFWIPATHGEKRAGSERYPEGFPGFGGKKVWVDRMLHITEEGEILEDINVLDVLYMNGLERYIPKALGGEYPVPEEINDDVTHLNDIEPLDSAMADQYPLFEAGDLVVSLRHLHLVFVLDPDSMEIKWHTSEPFIYQHDPDFIGDGWIGVFDNNYDLTGRGAMLGGSQIVALQPHTGKTEIRFPTQRSDPFYTDVRGKWQLLENGNMLLTEARAGRIVEVAADGSTVWEWIHAPVGDSRVPDVTKGTRYDLTEKEVAAWPCSSLDSADDWQ
ncbi:MAG: arylsulfotransferase family protein [Anaerolineae bacterium]